MPNPNVDPNREIGKEIPDRNRDPGADLEEQGIPEVADDEAPGRGDSPEPQRPSVPTDAPVFSTGHGTTEREVRAGEPLEHRLAHEEPDRATIDEPAHPDAEAMSGRALGIHVEREPSAPDDVYVEEDEAGEDR
jgi:hypothetical protein